MRRDAWMSKQETHVSLRHRLSCRILDSLPCNNIYIKEALREEILFKKKKKIRNIISIVRFDFNEILWLKFRACDLILIIEFH